MLQKPTTNWIRSSWLDCVRAHGYTIVAPRSAVAQVRSERPFLEAGPDRFRFLPPSDERHAKLAACQRLIVPAALPHVRKDPFLLTSFEALVSRCTSPASYPELASTVGQFLVGSIGLSPALLGVTVFGSPAVAERVWTELGVPEDRIRCDEGTASETVISYGSDEAVLLGRLSPTTLRGREHLCAELHLERLAAAAQGVSDVIETEALASVARAVESLTNRARVREQVRQITDHLRTALFCVDGGAVPSNQGAGRFVRALIRRATTDAIGLGLRQAELHALVPTLVAAYPELRARREELTLIVKSEEDRGRRILELSHAAVDAAIQEAHRQRRKAPSAEACRSLHERYGLCRDLLAFALKTRGLEPEAGESEQAPTGKAPTPSPGAAACRPGGGVLDQEATVQSVVPHGDETGVLLDRTPCLPKCNWHVGDQGTIAGPQGQVLVTRVEVWDGKPVHLGKLTGSLQEGDRASVSVDRERRQALCRSHTASHLLRWALASIFGERTIGGGLFIGPDQLRLDLSRFSPTTPEQLRRIETLTNLKIISNVLVRSAELPAVEAEQAGLATPSGLESPSVTVVSVGDDCKELCQGPHVRRTGEVGLMKLIGQEPLGAGLRRLRAETGPAALRATHGKEDLLSELAAVLGASESQLVQRVKALLAQNRAMKKALREGTTVSVTRTGREPDSRDRGCEDGA